MRLYGLRERAYLLRVSIHAPREGCDSPSCVVGTTLTLFQFTHPGRGATLRDIPFPVRFVFQFTHPGRGATIVTRLVFFSPFGFNSRTPGGVRPRRETRSIFSIAVSIHAPREGCDKYENAHYTDRQVSIHAPREGCDITSVALRGRRESFNSRTPGGVRLALTT